MESTQPLTEHPQHRVVVEVGSHAVSSAFCADRGILSGELYFSVNKKGEESSGIAELERERFKHNRFICLEADCREELPFFDESVDEIIFNNVFGSYYQNLTACNEFLREASRVLKPGGEIHITETNTPPFIPAEWFIGDRPNRDSDTMAMANPAYFQQFGLTPIRLSTKTEDIEHYRRRWVECGKKIPFDSSVFTLTLKKV
jgi:ubiquinone/menaquinone biosynthesis C-methylase UbiE